MVKNTNIFALPDVGKLELEKSSFFGGWFSKNTICL
jgi:hypothetical protein